MVSKKAIILLIVAIAAISFYNLYQTGLLKPHPKIIDRKQIDFRTLAIWVKNDSPFPGNVQITVNFYKGGTPIDSVSEYVYLNGYEIKKVEIKAPIKAIFSADKYVIFVRSI